MLAIFIFQTALPAYQCEIDRLKITAILFVEMDITGNYPNSCQSWGLLSWAERHSDPSVL